MQELYTFLIAKISAIEKRSLIDDRSLPPRANARGTRKFGEYSDRFEAIAQERRGGYTCPLRDLEGGDGGARREEGNKTAEGRDGRNRRNLLVPEGARRARTDYPSIISGRGGSGWRGEERRGRKKWRARENRGAAREKTRRLDEFSGGFSVPLNARTPRREPRYVPAWRAPFVSAARNDVINIVARLSNLRLRATRSRSGPLSPLVPTRPPASLSLSVSRSATPLSWGWLSSPRFEPLSRAENPLRCSRVTSSSLGLHHFSNVSPLLSSRRTRSFARKTRKAGKNAIVDPLERPIPADPSINACPRSRRDFGLSTSFGATFRIDVESWSFAGSTRQRERKGETVCTGMKSAAVIARGSKAVERRGCGDFTDSRDRVPV